MLDINFGGDVLSFRKLQFVSFLLKYLTWNCSGFTMSFVPFLPPSCSSRYLSPMILGAESQEITVVVMSFKIPLWKEKEKSRPSPKKPSWCRNILVFFSKLERRRFPSLPAFIILFYYLMGRPIRLNTRHGLARARGEMENIKQFAESCQHLRGLCAVIAFQASRATISVASSADVLIKDAAIRDKWCANCHFPPFFFLNKEIFFPSKLRLWYTPKTVQVFHADAWALTRTS